MGRPGLDANRRWSSKAGTNPRPCCPILGRCAGRIGAPGRQVGGSARGLRAAVGCFAADGGIDTAPRAAAGRVGVELACAGADATAPSEQGAQAHAGTTEAEQDRDRQQRDPR